MKSPQINLHIYGQLITDKNAKITQWGMDSLFNEWSCENWISTGKRMKLDPYLIPYTKSNQNEVKV